MLKRWLSLVAFAPVALVIASCGTPDEGTPTNADADTTVVAETPSATDSTAAAEVELTDFIVFFEEPEPLTIFAHDQLVCAPHSEVGDFLKRPDAPRVQLFDSDGELLATQELQGQGPVLDDVCSFHIKFLDVPVSTSYSVKFSGVDGDGVPYEFEGMTEFDQGKFEEGYTQGYTFELG